MIVTSVSVTKSFTRNLGNFESARVELGMSATPEEGESVDKVRERLSAKLDKWITEDVEEIDADRKG